MRPSSVTVATAGGKITGPDMASGCRPDRRHRYRSENTRGRLLTTFSRVVAFAAGMTLAATEFMKERLEPEIMQNYAGRTEQAATQPLTPSGSLEASGNNGSGGNTIHGRSERNVVGGHEAGTSLISGDYQAGVDRINQQAGSLSSPQNIADKLADRNFENTGKIGQIDGEISKNKSTVQASSDILRGEHQGAVKSQQIGRTEEDIKQTKPVFDAHETEELKAKLEQLRAQQKNAS